MKKSPFLMISCLTIIVLTSNFVNAQCASGSCWSRPAIPRNTFPTENESTILELIVPEYLKDVPFKVWDESGNVYETKTVGTVRVYEFPYITKGYKEKILIGTDNRNVWIEITGGSRNRIVLQDLFIRNKENGYDMFNEQGVKNYGIGIDMLSQRPRISPEQQPALPDWKKENSKCSVVVVGPKEIWNDFRKQFEIIPQTLRDEYFRFYYYQPTDWQIDYNGVKLPDGMTVFGPRDTDGKAPILHHQRDTDKAVQASIEAIRKVDPDIAERLQSSLPDARKPKPKPEPTPQPTLEDQPHPAVVVGATALSLLQLLGAGYLFSKRRSKS